VKRWFSTKNKTLFDGVSVLKDLAAGSYGVQACSYYTVGVQEKAVR